MRRPAAALVVSLIALSACGDDPATPFRVSAERACRRVADDGLQALAPVASLAPSDREERRAKRVLLRFARGGDAKVSDLIAARDAGLPGCADVLAGR